MAELKMFSRENTVAEPVGKECQNILEYYVRMYVCSLVKLKDVLSCLSHAWMDA